MRAMTITVPHRRQGLSALWNPFRRAALGLAVGVISFAAPARADELPIPQPAHAVAGIESDGLLRKKVSDALAADPTLARVDLVVSIVDRVAVIFGQVPDQAHIERVNAVVGKVPGLTAVKVHCWAMAPAATDPFAERLAGQLKGDAKPLPPANTNGTPIPPLTLPAPRLGSAAPPGLAAKPSFADDQASRVAAKVAMDRPGGFGPMSEFLLDPVPVARRPARGGAIAKADPAQAYPTIPPSSLPVKPVSDVRPATDRVAEVRAADPRFAGLAVQVQDGTAVVARKPGRGKDAWAFAEALRTVPGLTRVIVRDVQ
jgi:hypothetical protein